MRSAFQFIRLHLRTIDRRRFVLPAIALLIVTLLSTFPAMSATISSLVTCASTSACVAGSNTSTGPGVQGNSTKGNGVYGTTASTSTAGNSGVLGNDATTNNKNTGVKGSSNKGIGVLGTSTSGTAVKGMASGAAPGVYGVSSGPGSSNSTVGVYGSSSNIGLGGGGSNIGIQAQGGTYGVQATGTSYGVYGAQNTGCCGDGIYGYGYYGAVGQTSDYYNGTGVQAYGGNYGVNASGYNFGVYGTGNSYGLYGNGGSYGVYGNGSSEGVEGTSSYTGVYASGNSYGVLAYGSTALYGSGGSYGVAGYGGSWGVTGQGSYAGTTGANESGTSGTAVLAQGNTTSGFLFRGNNTSSVDVFTVDNSGNGYFSGQVSARAFVTHAAAAVVQDTSTGAPATTYASQATETNIEHMGEATLVGGVANVRFDLKFSSMLSREAPYMVVLTPQGPTESNLYVAQKTSSGFIVRENHNGRSTVVFDYRVVGRPYSSQLKTSSDNLQYHSAAGPIHGPTIPKLKPHAQPRGPKAPARPKPPVIKPLPVIK